MRKRLGRPLAVCLYGAFRSEADPADLAASCMAKGDVIYAPRVAPGGETMEVRRLASPADWIRGRYGVPEPDPSRTEGLSPGIGGKAGSHPGAGPGVRPVGAASWIRRGTLRPPVPAGAGRRTVRFRWKGTAVGRFRLFVSDRR